MWVEKKKIKVLEILIFLMLDRYFIKVGVGVSELVIRVEGFEEVDFVGVDVIVLDK